MGGIDHRENDASERSELTDDARTEPAAAQGHRYRPKASVVKHCRICQEAADYEAGWGMQHFDGPHVVVIEPGGPYGVDLDVFFATHEPVRDRPDCYVKVVRVRAWVATEPCILRTEVKGRVEMVAEVPAGGIIVEQQDGDRYSMTLEEFELRYELDE